MKIREAFPLSIHRFVFSIHPFNCIICYQSEFERGGGLVLEEIVDIGRQSELSKLYSAFRKHFLIACGGAFACRIIIERGDDAKTRERREPFFFETARADQ